MTKKKTKKKTWKFERPDYWGLIVRPDWAMCEQGRRQSPINIDPAKLLYDPHLRPLHIDKHAGHGFLTNNGHNMIFRVGNTSHPHINISGGPLSYKYRVQELRVHFGMKDTHGSEHTVNGKAFPLEVQIVGYNSDLYANMSQATHLPQGLVAISLLAQVGKTRNQELTLLIENITEIIYKDQRVPASYVSVSEMLPDTQQYITYEGSTTTPGCQETVTWIIINKPIYVTTQQLNTLRGLHQGTIQHPQAHLGNNYRPPQPLHHRPVRANIEFNLKQGRKCPSMKPLTYYKDTAYEM
ncbi:PREDICTED: putative carbonic anhydrase-like protein 1 [Priapulus caudatus]|uniref:Carbonic anhydrase-like protein 1 n=1 Tax=Priapulus caudatus TaxID=37621 RepID=A0ABM1E5R8_PRICU|nr:PREDICTED: putative carbonic anhydrase-like protein 1 [Priapulus caudatus]